MAKISSKPKKKANSADSEINPKNAKFVLFVFGIGPIIILFLFLYMNGFFT